MDDDNKGKKGKKHFTIPDNEVQREDTKRIAIPEPVEIDFRKHGEKIGEGLLSIKERNTPKHNILSDDLLFFQVELPDDKVVDSRGDYERIFADNKININAIRDSHKAIVSIKKDDMISLEESAVQYTQGTAPKSSFWQYIDEISPIDIHDKKSKKLDYLQNNENNNDIIDAQITVVPKLNEKQYAKILPHLITLVESFNGDIESDGIYYLADHTPVLHAYLPSSAVNDLIEQEVVLDIDITHKYNGSHQITKNGQNVAAFDFYSDNLDDLPLICVLDDGVSFPDNISAAIAGRWTAPDINYNTSAHGTKVASRIVFGENLHEQINNQLLIPKARIIDAVISDGNTVTETKIISRIRKAVQEIKHITTTFCLAFNDNSSSIFGEKSVSKLAFELDVISYKEGVNFVVSMGNHELWRTLNDINDICEHDDARLASPAESLHSLSIGSITKDQHPDSISNKNALSPFSRVGYGFANSYKPDLVYPGGNVCKQNTRCFIPKTSGMFVINSDGYISLDFGTSFSTPLAAFDLGSLQHSVIEYLNSTGDTNNLDRKATFISRGLLSHHAKSIDNMSDTSTEEYNKVYGCGYGNLDSAKESFASKPTYIRYGKMNRKTKEKVGFLIPAVLSDKRKSGVKLAKVTVTCLSISPVDMSKGSEYLRAYIDTSLHMLNSNSKLVTKNPSQKNGRKKWSNLHHFSQEFTVFDSGDWQLWLELYTKPEIPDEEEIEYVLIITIESLYENEELNLYGEIEATNRFNILQEISIDIGTPEEDE
ncbi:S8 family serine peptidase [Enterococcus faecalis]|uniref:S8 family serine peptidase n=1 Tax=Enterococcus faecalis TaxID=1351 RepID=UPI002543669B|nr:S8 family serine peptidase [Enterococcus faecalis]MDK4397280.1 S8 family serine peptidase [Enterococcus faecalis]MDK4415916.1 S8 family serine peptidase [Enterococcus faecalis]